MTVEATTTRPDLTSLSVHELFELRVSEQPEAPALVAGDRRLSYADLNAQADRIAGRLRDRGVGPGQLVGLHLERSVELVAALLGVLKTGAGYFVLDPAYPAARRDAELGEVRPALVVASEPAVGDWPTLDLRSPAGPATAIPSRSEALGAAQPAARRPQAAGRPDDIACVMFTSGSTGRPKGVLASHRAIVGSLVGQQFGGFGPGEVVLQSAPVSWDGFVLELLGTLLLGGTTVLQPGSSPEPAAIARLVATHRVTVMFASARLLDHLIDEHPETFTGLGQVLTGGETASSTHLAELQRRHPALRIMHGYGPVETMIVATAQVLTTRDTSDPVVPIGAPIEGKQVHVLDAALQPVAPGATGEIYIAGIGLAHGYLNQPGTTAGRFIANPFGPPGDRMYRTGDLGRWRPDGLLEYGGRADHQVKVRGFRLEPGELQFALERHPAIAHAVVVLRDDAPGGKGLVAYVVPAPGGALDEATVRQHAEEVLPRHAIPAAVVLLTELPLNNHGKLDRTALPAPALAEVVADGTGTPRQELLRGLFAEVLGTSTDRIRLDDEFLALGGHSLLAAKLANRIRTTLGRELDLATLLDARTVRRLDERIDAAPAATPPLRRVADRPDPLPLSAGQQRLWFLDRTTGGGPAYHVALAVRLAGELDPQALQAALADVVARHEILRTVFPAGADDEPIQQVLDSVQVPLPAVAVEPADLDRAVAEAARWTIDLTAEPPLYAKLLVPPAGEAVLVLVLHHIAFDGWSMTPLLRDLSTAYSAHRAGHPADLPTLAVQYADYTLWLEQLSDQDGLQYWTETLAGLPGETELPGARPYPARRSPTGGIVPLTVDADLYRGLAGLAREADSTVFMVLHAALAALLSGTTTDLAVGTPVANRPDEALDEVIGFFVNTVVLRLDTAGDPTFTELLTRARASDLAAFDHQTVPFDRVVAALNPERRAGRHPLFQVMLAVHAGLDASVERLHIDTAQFDLTVDLTETLDPAGVPGGLTGWLEYAADRYDAATARKLADQFAKVLGAVVADPGIRLSALRPQPAAAHPFAGGGSAPWQNRSTGTSRQQKVLRRIFANVLGVTTVGDNDSFFDLGGHSLLATRLISQVRSALGVEIDMATLFEAPTVADLTRQLADAQQARPALRPRSAPEEIR
jgi:amino acid adenylation domain-containing protein